jgi:ATP-dependent Lhr-like helicase
VPQLLGRELAEAMRSILLDTAPVAYASDKAQVIIDDWRADLGPLVRASRMPIRRTELGTEVWTFAGGRVNTTLRLALKVIAGVESTADNLRLRIPQSHSGGEDGVDRLMAVTANGDWQALEQTLAASRLLPAYRLSKFQDALPEPWSRETVRDYLVSVSETEAWMNDTVTGER